MVVFRLSVKRLVSVWVLCAFMFTQAMPGYAQGIPTAAAVAGFTPVQLTGIVIDPKDPFHFDFIIDRGQDQLPDAARKDIYTSQVKYFLAALAIPDKDQWVNLSPYEQDRIIPDNFGLTLMGRDLLSQDYLLKQIASKMTSPQTSLGKDFWDKVYAAAHEKFGTTDIPTDVFNKVWIIPESAVLYEKDGAVYVQEHHLKVLLDSDYLALNKSRVAAGTSSAAQEMIKDVMREVVIPVLEKEVNEGRDFAPLRQVYSGMLLAVWYKRTLQGSLLNQVYTDRARVRGIDQDPQANKEIYARYVEAFRQGAFNLIKEDVDQFTREVIPRRYFSGGLMNADAAMFEAGKVQHVPRLAADALRNQEAVSVRLVEPGKNVKVFQATARGMLAKAVGDLAPGDPWGSARMLLDQVKLDMPAEILAYQQEMSGDAVPAKWASLLAGYQEKGQKKKLVLKKIGEKAGIVGNTLYYPFAGGDTDEPFSMSANIRHVMAMGQEPFGSVAQIKEFFMKVGYADRFGDRNRDGYDHGDRLSKLNAVAGLAMARIIVTLKARVVGIKYFDIEQNGDVRFKDLVQGDVPSAKNAVIVFQDRDGQIKTFWYCQYNVTMFAKDIVRPDPFRRMVNRMKFQTLLIKAAQSFLFEGIIGLNTAVVVGEPARRNDALVLTDSRLDHKMEPIAFRDIPQPVFSVKPSSISWLGWSRVGYGGSVYYGRARAILADVWNAPLQVWKARPYVPDIVIDNVDDVKYEPSKLMDGVLFTELKDRHYEVKSDAVRINTEDGNEIEIVRQGAVRWTMRNVVDIEVSPRDKVARIYYDENNEWREARLDLNTGAFTSQSLWDSLAQVDMAQTRERTAGDPLQRAREFLKAQRLDMPRELEKWQAMLRQAPADSVLGKELAVLRRENEVKTDALVEAGQEINGQIKAGGVLPNDLTGEVGYYPFGGSDFDEPARLAGQWKDLIVMGQEPFGSRGIINLFFVKGNRIVNTPGRGFNVNDVREQFGFKKKSFDEHENLKKLKYVGVRALGRIITYLEGEVVGIKYFDLDREGNVNFVESGSSQARTNAVVVFKDKDGQERRCWYFQHSLEARVSAISEQVPFRAFINRASFQFMIIKAAQSDLFEGILGLNTYTVVGRPAKRNNALVLADQRTAHPTYGRDYGIVVDQQPVFKDVPRKYVFGGVPYGYGYKLFYAPVSALATPFTAPSDVVGYAPYAPDIKMEYAGSVDENAPRVLQGVTISRDGDYYSIRKGNVRLETKPRNTLVYAVDGKEVVLSGVSDVHVYMSKSLVLVYYFADGAWREGQLSLLDGVFKTKMLQAARIAAGEDAAQADDVPSRQAWDPLKRAQEALKEQSLTMSAGLSQWQAIVRDPAGPLASTIRQIRKDNRVYAAKLHQAGHKMHMPDGVIYYPFGGMDAADPFMMSAGITDVVSMGHEDFGSLKQIDQFFRTGHARAVSDGLRNPGGFMFDHLGGREGSFDSVANYWDPRRAKGWKGFGQTAVARILTLLEGRIEGVQYFVLDPKGDIQFVDAGSKKAGVNAVVVFYDKNGNEKRFWYMRHYVGSQIVDVPRTPFELFIRKASFQTLLIKAAQSWLFEGVQGLNVQAIVHEPARRNGAMVITDINIPDDPFGFGTGAPQPVFARVPQSLDMGGRYRFGYGKHIFFALADKLTRPQDDPFYTIGRRLYRPAFVADGDRQVIWRHYHKFFGDVAVEGTDESFVIHAGTVQLSITGDNRVVFRENNEVRKAWALVTDVQLDSRGESVLIYYFDKESGWHESRLDLKAGTWMTKALDFKGMMLAEEDALRNVSPGDENVAADVPGLDADTRARLEVLFSDFSKPLGDMQRELRAIFPQGGISLTKDGFHFNRDRMPAPDEVLGMAMRYFQGYNMGNRVFTVADFNTEERELARQNIVNDETPSEISSKSYQDLELREKDQIFEALARRVQSGRMLHVDHHYGYHVLAQASTAAMLLDFVRYLHAHGKQDTLGRLKDTFIFSDHSDVDIMLANFVLRHAGDQAFLEANREAIINAVSINDYALDKGSRAGVILYDVLVAMGEDVKAHGFDEEKMMAVVEDALVFANQNADLEEAALFARAGSLYAGQSAAVVDYFLKGVVRFLKASQVFNKMMAASDGHLNDRQIVPGQMRILDRVLFCYVRDHDAELDNTDIARIISSSPHYRKMLDGVLAIATTNPVPGQAGDRRFKIRALDTLDLSPEFWNELGKATVAYGTHPGGRSMGGGLGKEALKDLLPLDVAKIAVSISSLVEKHARIQDDSLKAKGGIDLGDGHLNMIIRRDSNNIPLPVAQQGIERFKIDGLVPEILDIRPAASLPLFSQSSSAR
ncbi:MAG: hypothetical protein HQL17_00665 [Candidatus Omnitrophica bacterium]|nr:hypothetical protein [Candidatus Omnitrophota bacterium]